MDKYETLLAAVLALDPFGDKFLTIVNITESNGRHLASLGGCTQCGAEKGSHTPECPVTHLRNILTRDYTAACDRSALQLKKDMEATLILNEAKLELDKAMSFITSPTDNGV